MSEMEEKKRSFKCHSDPFDMMAFLKKLDLVLFFLFYFLFSTCIYRWMIDTRG